MKSKYPRYFVGGNCPHTYWLVRNENSIFVKIDVGVLCPSLYKNIDQLINDNQDTFREVTAEELSLMF